MTDAQTLLTMQELDLAIARAEEELSTLPELKALAQHRGALQRLKAEATRLMAVRKDVEIELEDLEEQLTACEQAVTETQEAAAQLTNYHEVQDFELRLSDLAKQLDKLAFAREAKQTELTEARGREDEVTARVSAFEQAVLNDAQRARRRATEIQSRLEADRKRRAQLAATLDATVLARYEQALTRHRGLAVEQLTGSVPSICRMTLTESSLSDLANGDAIAECPYCHRILIRDAAGEAS